MSAVLLAVFNDHPDIRYRGGVEQIVAGISEQNIDSLALQNLHNRGGGFQSRISEDTRGRRPR